MVFEAAVLDRVDRRLEPRRRRREPVEHGAQPQVFGARARRQIQPVEGGERGRRRTGGGEQPPQEFSGLPGGLRDRGGILAVERRAQRRCSLAVDAESRGHRRDQGRQRDVDRQMRHAEGGQRCACDCDRFDIGGRPRGADQLGADLADLALGADLRAFDPQHLAGIAQAQRPRCVAEPGRGDTRDLRGHVGAHPDHAVRPGVHRAKGGGGHRRPRARQQRVLEFDQRRLDPLVAMRGQDRHQPRNDLRLDLGFGRQQIVHADGQQRGVRGVVHPVSLHHRDTEVR